MTATPATTPAPATEIVFKVFNQGGRLFTHHELDIPPGKFTTVPSKYVEGIKKLIKAYPTELTSAETAHTAHAGSAAQINELTLRAEKAEADVKKLQGMILEDTKELTARAERAETQLKEALQNIRQASDTITLLGSDKAALEDKVQALTREHTAQIEKLTAPPTTPVAVQVAPPTGKKR